MNKKNRKKGAITFKRWRGTPWAPFASLKKCIRIGVLSVTYSLLTMAYNTAISQTKTTNTGERVITLDELVINRERPSPFQPLVKVVAVIEQKEIERASIETVQDLLRYIQGADVRSRGVEGVQADLNLFGGTFDQSMVLINGVNFTDPQSGHHSLNIPIELSQIERIELLQGPGAWADGAVAYSGAINIITKRPNKNSLNSSFTIGEHSLFRGSLNSGISLLTPSGNWDISGQAGGGYGKSKGYAPNTDFDILNLFSNFTIKNQHGDSFDFYTGYQQKEFGANSFYSTTYPQQFETTRLLLTSLKYLRLAGRWQLGGALSFRRHHDHFELFRYEAPEWYQGDNYHLNDVFGANAKVAYRWKTLGSTVFGIDYRAEQIFSTVLGDDIVTPSYPGREIPKESGLYFTKSKKRESTSLYLRHIIQLPRWRFTAGIMATASDNSGLSINYKNRIYAGLAATYTIFHTLEIEGWVNNSYRNPTFTDLYYQSPTQSGNLNLKPEEAIGGQLSLNYTTKPLLASLSLFYRYGYSIIDWTRESGNELWKAGNLTNISSYGSNMSLTYKPSSSTINRLSLYWSWMGVNKQSNNMHSLYATDYLKHKVEGGIDHTLFWYVGMIWNLSWQKREGSYLGRDNREIPYRGFFLTDVRVLWEKGTIHPFIDITNLFNSDYLYIGNLPQPKRWIKAGVNISI